MKKLIRAIIAVAILALLATVLGPNLILQAVTQPTPAESYAYSDSFHTTYEEVRTHLQSRVKRLQEAGIAVQTTEYAVNSQEELYIDNIYLPATEKNTNLVVLTTGVHGISAL